MSHALVRLRTLRALLPQLAGLGPEGARLADELEEGLEYLRFGRPLTEALGLEAAPGEAAPWDLLTPAMMRRDLVAVLLTMFAGDPTARAKAAAAAACRYASDVWPRDAIRTPNYKLDTPEAILYRLHRNREGWPGRDLVAGAKWPVGWRTIHRLCQNYSPLGTFPLGAVLKSDPARR